MAAERQVNIIVNFLAKGLGELTTQLKGLNTEMAALRGETSKTRTQVSGLGKDAGDASKGLNEYTKNSKKAGTESEKLNNSSKKARGGFANFGKQLVNTAAFLLRFAAVTAIFSGLTFAIVGTAKAAAEFEAALADLQAIANVSNSDMEKLSKNVLDVAGSTRFTATEIVGLQKSLARLGFSTNQIINSTEAMARFAEATGESSEEVATFVGKQMKAFGLATIQATELTNAYTTAINNSALTLESLATSSQYVSSISSALGVSFKEQNALLATLADTGLTASRAGTGLRKIFLELGADGGSLIPILDELAESQLTLSEAEELVGDRAAGALLALVGQRQAVSDLVMQQNSLTSTLIASARQNATFAGQIDGLSAAVDKLLIKLGNWVTKTEIVLELIELLSGDTTLRGFNVIKDLGLTGDETDKAISKINELEGGIDSLIKEETYYVQTMQDGQRVQETRVRLSADEARIQEFLNVSKERAAEIGEKLLEIRSKDNENLDAGTELLSKYKGQQDEVNLIVSEADKGVKKYDDRLKDLQTTQKAGGDIESDRNKLYSDIQDELDSVVRELGEYENLVRDLDETEIKNVNILEAKQSKLLSLQQATINLKEATEDLGEAEEKQLETFSKIYNLRVQLGEAQRMGDIPAMKGLREELMAQYELLEKEGLVDAFGEYVALVSDLIDIPRQGLGGGGEAGVAEAIFNSLGAQIEAGLITPAQAKDSMLETIKKLIASTEDEDVVIALEELQRKVRNGIFNPAAEEDEPAGLTLFGLNEEDTKFLIDKAAELANSVNGAILDATQRRLEAEQAAVDARYSFEEDRLNSLLQAGIVSQEQFERQRLRLEKERVAKTNEIERKRFNAEKANSLAQIAINTAVGIAGKDPIRIAIISAVAAAQAAIVASQKFVPTKFKKGGMIEGASHEQGGVPFTVAGRAGFEAEGGEFIVNKRATEAFLPMLERINSFGNSSIPVQRQAFANGGVVPQGGGRTDDLLEQLVSQSSQRTIAYISEEQLISRNNTRITNDIRKRL